METTIDLEDCPHFDTSRRCCTNKMKYNIKTAEMLYHMLPLPQNKKPKILFGGIRTYTKYTQALSTERHFAVNKQVFFDHYKRIALG